MTDIQIINDYSSKLAYKTETIVGHAIVQKNGGEVILIPFVENHLRKLSSADQKLYECFLEQEDTDMFKWLLRNSP